MIIYNFFKNLFLNIKYSKILRKIYKEESLLDNLSKLFGSNFKIDKIGRVYAVINPLIVNGVYDPNKVVFEYGEEGLGTDEYMERIIMNKMNIANQFIKNNNLFELLTYKITRLDNVGNFLFVFQPITLEDCINYTKKFSILLCSLVILLIAGLIIF